MARLSLLVAAILLILSGLVIAQDGGTASQVYKVVLDNDRVRVMRASFKPGDKVGMRKYPSRPDRLRGEFQDRRGAVVPAAGARD